MDSNLLLLALEVKKLKKKVSAPPVPVKGNKGDKGDKGETGARGADGLDGQQGAKGDKGDNGKDGENGVNGVSVVDAEVDIDGTLAFSLSNGETIKTSGEVVGPKGPPGMQGAAGVGIAAAGTTGQVLTKASDDNFDTTWSTPFSPASPSAIGNVAPAAGSFTTLIGGAGSANYAQITGGATTKAVQFQTLGTDTNISVAVQSKGTGAIDLAAGSQGVNISNGGTVTALTTTASGTSYTSAPTATISVPTTAGGVQATAQPYVQSSGAYAIVGGGTGYTTGDTITFSGGTGTISATATITASAGVITAVSFTSGGAYTVTPTNPVSVTGGTGSGATFNLTQYILRTSAPTWNITNAGSGYVEQPTVTFSGGGGSGAAAFATVGSIPTIKTLGSALSFATPSGEMFRLLDAAVSSSNYLSLEQGGGGIIARTGGSGTNLPISFSTKGTGGYVFGTNSSVSTQQFGISHTASAVNYVQVTGAATGGRVTISSQGSDTNIGMLYNLKGAASHVFQTNSNNIQHVIVNQPSSVNWCQTKGNIAGASPVFSVEGSDTNIDLTLTPKGTGVIQFGTYTATILTPTGYITIKDSGGTTRRLLVG